MARILVVDDDKDMCHLISEILQEESYEVIFLIMAKMPYQRLRKILMTW